MCIRDRSKPLQPTWIGKGLPERVVEEQKEKGIVLRRGSHFQLRVHQKPFVDCAELTNQTPTAYMDWEGTPGAGGGRTVGKESKGGRTATGKRREGRNGKEGREEKGRTDRKAEGGSHLPFTLPHYEILVPLMGKENPMTQWLTSQETRCADCHQWRNHS